MSVLTIFKISISICTLALIVAYGTIAFLLGGIKIANSVLKVLLSLRFNKEYQQELIKKVTTMLNKQLKLQLNKIIETKNKEIIEKLDVKITNEKINEIKKLLKEVVVCDDIVPENYVKDFCKKNHVFSFIDNLNEFIKLAPLLSQTKNNQSNIIDDLLTNKTKPIISLLNFDINKIYKSCLLV